MISKCTCLETIITVENLGRNLKELTARTAHFYRNAPQGYYEVSTRIGRSIARLDAVAMQGLFA